MTKEQPPQPITASVGEFLRALQKNWFALTGSVATVGAPIVAAVTPANESAVFFAFTACCGVMSAYLVWEGERNVRLQLQQQLAPRPFISVEYSFDATDEERDVRETLSFENIGKEPARAVTFVTRPVEYRGFRPRPYWPLTQLLPEHGPAEETVIDLRAMLSAIYRDVPRERRGDAVRIPLEVHYADLQGRTWADEHVAVYNGYGLWIEAVTVAGPRWTEVSDLRT